MSLTDTENNFRYERVLLINPPYPGSMERGALRAGLGYVAEALEQAGIEYEVLDMDLGYGLSDLKRRIKTFSPTLVGVSIMTYKYSQTYDLLHFIKNVANVPIVVGGPHICALEDKVLQECLSVDFGIVGEGEEALVELCRGSDLDKIQGLVYRHNGDIMSGNERGFITNLDAIPYPKYRGFELNKYASRTIPIVSSRGCPNRCIFCTVSVSMGKKVRTRSPANVVDELEYWYGRGQRRFGIADDNFTFFAQKVFDICDEIERRELRDLKLLCINGVRADKVSKELLLRMKEVGFCSIGIGVEGGNDKILKTIRKDETMAIIERAIENACNLGYEVSLHFVIGTPGETWKDIEDAFALAKKYPVRNAYFNNLIPYPKTELYEWVASRSRFLIDPVEYFDTVSTSANIPVFETPELSKEERVQALKQARLVTKEVRRSYYVRKLEKFGIGALFLGRLVSLSDDFRDLLREGKWGRMLIRMIKPFLR